MKIAVTGSSGLIGQHLGKEFLLRGWEMISIQRQELYSGGHDLAEKLKGTEAVIHLAGAPIMHRWTAGYRQEMMRSRIETTLNISRAFSLMQHPPQLFISTSAIGIYNSTDIHTEEKCVFADDFLGKLCQAWESSVQIAEGRTRLVIYRLGVVLASDGGALLKIMIPFKLGIGGPVGTGTQYFSWVHINDLVRAFVFAIENKISGIFNLCAPSYISNALFSEALAAAMRRKSWLRVPPAIMRLVYGEAARVLTSGQAAVPERLLKEGFVFGFPDVQPALKDLINYKKIER